MGVKTDTEELMGRLNRLERRARNFQLILVSIGVLGAGLVLMGQARPVRELTVSRLAVADSKGRARVIVEATTDGPDITCFDANGEPIARLGELSDGGTLALWDGKSKANIGLMAREGHSMLALWDESKTGGGKHGSL